MKNKIIKIKHKFENSLPTHMLLNLTVSHEGKA